MTMRKLHLMVMVGAVAAIAAGCTRIEPHVETAKNQIAKADAYLSDLVGVQKAEPPRSLSATDTSSPTEVKAK